eukprot:1195096-Amphidinium_carterae.1
MFDWHHGPPESVHDELVDYFLGKDVRTQLRRRQLKGKSTRLNMTRPIAGELEWIRLSSIANMLTQAYYHDCYYDVD